MSKKDSMQLTAVLFIKSPKLEITHLFIITGTDTHTVVYSIYLMESNSAIRSEFLTQATVWINLTMSILLEKARHKRNTETSLHSLLVERGGFHEYNRQNIST